MSRGKNAVNMSKIIRFAILFMLLTPSAMLLSGCPKGVYGSIITPEQLTQVNRGKSTKQDVIRILGEPDEVRNIGVGQEELSYVRATVGTHYNFLGYGNYKKTELWVIIKNNVVEAYGERDIE